MADTEPFGALPEPFYLPPPEETFDLPETFDTWLLSGLAGEQEKEGGCSKKRTRRGSGSSVDTGTETQCSGLSCDTTTSKKRCLAAVKEERAENDGESKQLDRKEKNRRSAAASRLRKKAAMEELQLKVRQLETENATLKYREAMANREIMFLRNELASLNTSAGRGQPAEHKLDFPPLESPLIIPKDLVSNLCFRQVETERLLSLVSVKELYYNMNPNNSSERKHRRPRNPPS
ncbi:BZIP domain-containing protein [Chloropicon primus]|uniref:BZIP domain-containing protein n=1 Tax=Chloropicon primus TaxID=1764295 RepID=A0A5B8MI47_9CHLO|nr:hypothetical protein A3770_03p22520 [Chloropicon primus]UPQ98945.1 BZIP domain-containing protein [Chloropicon primus]|eukprot:QDZ19734.1 hypothetical protein A3770_03p22520 [Chloropicon primus]